MPVPTIEWIGDENGHARLIDQTLLPGEFRRIDCKNLECLWQAIRELKVRGAPAIGIAGAFGVLLGLQEVSATEVEPFFRELSRITDYLATSRPTAVNLFWALERMTRTAKQNRLRPIPEIRQALLNEARAILEEDRAICREIGRHGAELLAEGQGILTHCNAGGLATGDYGTALAVFFCAHGQGKQFHVYADETRPLLQGARLTTWELMREGIDVTLICDNMAATVMRQKRVDCVIVGADRIAANGDTANKIGTYGLAILAREHALPFYVAAPVSTFDLSIPDGSHIPIEERSPEEITCGWGKRTAPEGVQTYNPAFDVTPAAYITAIITERGIIRPVSTDTIRTTCERRP